MVREMSETDKVKGDTPRELRMVRAGDDPRVPWWANWGMKALMILGIPGALLGWREWKDYKLEERRLVVEEKRVEADQKQNVLLERFEKVLWRVERRLPTENGGSDR
jgi:hypothetical protein